EHLFVVGPRHGNHFELRPRREQHLGLLSFGRHRRDILARLAKDRNLNGCAKTHLDTRAPEHGNGKGSSHETHLLVLVLIPGYFTAHGHSALIGREIRECLLGDLNLLLVLLARLWFDGIRIATPLIYLGKVISRVIINSDDFTG